MWALIDISMACAQSVRRAGNMTDSMALVVLFQGLYIGDALYNEVRLPSCERRSISIYRTHLASACVVHHYGHYLRRLRVYARDRIHMGALCLLPSSKVSRLQPD